MSFESFASDGRPVEKRQDARDLQLRLYRELGVLAVAAELGISSQQAAPAPEAAQKSAWNLRPIGKKVLAA